MLPKKKFFKKELEDLTHLEDHHVSELEPHPPEIHSVLPSHDNVTHINYYLPIALSEGVPACT